GTTGYAYGLEDTPENGQPLLYDRTTRSLWLPEGRELVCVNGPAKGTKLPEVRNPERTTWSRWVAQHPDTRILMASHRHKPGPAWSPPAGRPGPAAPGTGPARPAPAGPARCGRRAPTVGTSIPEVAVFLKRIELTNLRSIDHLDLSFERADGGIRKWTLLLG